VLHSLEDRTCEHPPTTTRKERCHTTLGPRRSTVGVRHLATLWWRRALMLIWRWSADGSSSHGGHGDSSGSGHGDANGTQIVTDSQGREGGAVTV